jgi:hypothetical protein
MVRDRKDYREIVPPEEQCLRTHSSPSKKRDFRKLHLASECHAKDEPICSWTLTAGNRHDSPRFRTLLRRVHGEIGAAGMPTTLSLIAPGGTCTTGAGIAVAQSTGVSVPTGDYNYCATGTTAAAGGVVSFTVAWA